MFHFQWLTQQPFVGCECEKVKMKNVNVNQEFIKNHFDKRQLYEQQFVEKHILLQGNILRQMLAKKSVYFINCKKSFKVRLQ